MGNWGKKVDGKEERIHVRSFYTERQPTLWWFISRGFLEHALLGSIGGPGDEDRRCYNQLPNTHGSPVCEGPHP